MIREGMIAKGVAFYNRWASVAGYPSIAAVGPSTIDMHEVVVEVRGGEMRVADVASAGLVSAPPKRR
jgi:phage terminase large subunit-like protein